MRLRRDGGGDLSRCAGASTTPKLVAHRANSGARRIILTHMSREMLAHAGEVPEECIHDGMVVEPRAGEDGVSASCRPRLAARGSRPGKRQAGGPSPRFDHHMFGEGSRSSSTSASTSSSLL